MDQEKIGKFIAELRKEKGLTQAQLAEHFDISNNMDNKTHMTTCLQALDSDNRRGRNGTICAYNSSVNVEKQHTHCIFSYCSIKRQ